MLAIHDQHDQFTHQMRNRLRTTGMGLGLVRLLLDAGLTEEARATLSSLQHGFQGIPTASDKPSQKPSKANRLKRHLKEVFVRGPQCELLTSSLCQAVQSIQAAYHLVHLMHGNE